MADALGDRMKSYEGRESERRFLPMLPVCARIDGRNFSAFTRGMERPYDIGMTEAMIVTTEQLVAKTHARIGYTQSDEISLVWQADDASGSIFFDHRVAKMTSVLASLATILFNAALSSAMTQYQMRLPHFDCRVWQVPNMTEAANVFLWRERDATKNAVSMTARSVYSHQELDHKTSAEMQEMMFAKGINFNDYPPYFKRGTFVQRKLVLREMTPEELNTIPEVHRPPPGQMVERSKIIRLDMPRFGSVTNREAVIFDGAKPLVEGENPSERA